MYKSYALNNYAEKTTAHKNSYLFQYVIIS